ncbi:hypothetical protein [Devosia ginsengisoli]|uniref:hypothetical protein n=1 Tax=Devosia ginsengisoli TaxID=400770 RepID=UPI0034E98AA1
MGGGHHQCPAKPETEDFKFSTNAENSAKIAERNAILPTTIGAEVGVKDPSAAESRGAEGPGDLASGTISTRSRGPNVGRVVNDMSAELRRRADFA